MLRPVSLALVAVCTVVSTAGISIFIFARNPTVTVARGAVTGAVVATGALGDARVRLAQEHGLPQSGQRMPRLRTNASPPPALTARAGLLIDRASGATIFEKSAGTLLPLASLTKLASAATVVVNGFAAHTPVTVRPEDESAFPDAAHTNDVLTAEDLLTLSLVGSSNNASRALIRATGFTNESFAVFAKARAGAHGAHTVQFAEPTGLSPKNRGSAHDVAALLEGALAHPMLAPLLRAREATVTVSGAPRVVKSTNGVLNGHVAQMIDEVVAAKTGYIEESGYNFTMVAKKDGRELLVVVLGAKDHFSRFTEAQALIEWAVNNFVWPS